MRLIDADALMRRLCVQCDVESHEATCDPDECFVYNVIVYDAPTIDAEPVRHGRWVDRYGDKYDNHLYECSECKGKALYRFEVDELGKEIAVQDLSDYCPHCGAKMDGGGSGEG